MKHLIALIVSLLLAIVPAEATIIDGWTSYFAYHDVTEVVEADGKVFAIASGNLFSYDTSTTEVRQYDAITTGLSSKGVALIDYSEECHTLVIVYTDGNIDLFNIRNERITNIPQFRDNPDSNFALNKLIVCGEHAVVSTNEAVLLINVKKGVIIGRFSIGATKAAAAFGGRLYAAPTKGGLISCGLNENLLDNKSWTTDANVTVNDLAFSGDALYYDVLNSNADTNGVWSITSDGKRQRISPYTPKALRGAFGRVIGYGYQFIYYTDSPEPKDNTVFSSNELFVTATPASDGGYWVANGTRGIMHYEIKDQTFVHDELSIVGEGPSYEYPYNISFIGNHLYLVSGQVDNNDQTHRPYFATYMDEFGHWHDFEAPTPDGPWKYKNHDFQDATSIVQDPADPDHHFVSSQRQGIFEYRGQKIVKQYTRDNSLLRSCSASKSYDYVRTNSLIYDAEGNLFFVNNSVDTIIYCIKRDGTWVPFLNQEIKKANTFEHSIIDKKGRLWLTQRYFLGDIRAGFLCLDFNGTIDNPNDDLYTFRQKFINQDGTPFDFLNAYAIAEDHDGRIWLGTDIGIVVCDNPDEWSQPDFLVTQIKVPRNDGTNFADYLLADVPITAIAIDGANRKWIGTDGDGVYLVSADGIHTIHHFTETNCPLVSNIIWSIACHPSNGEVFIGTDKGLMSFHSDASESSESLDRDNLRVYPNPVRPDYYGPIILDGLVFDSDIKVVSTSGRVVAAGTSVGGTFTWDGTGPDGRRVASGVYHFMIATPDGKTTAAAKVAIVR